MLARHIAQGEQPFLNILQCRGISIQLRSNAVQRRDDLSHFYRCPFQPRKRIIQLLAHLVRHAIQCPLGLAQALISPFGTGQILNRTGDRLSQAFCILHHAAVFRQFFLFALLGGQLVQFICRKPQIVFFLSCCFRSGLGAVQRLSGRLPGGIVSGDGLAFHRQAAIGIQQVYMGVWVH